MYQRVLGCSCIVFGTVFWILALHCTVNCNVNRIVNPLHPPPPPSLAQLAPFLFSQQETHNEMHICVARVVMYQRALASYLVLYFAFAAHIANYSVPLSPGLFLTPEKVALTQRGVKGRLQPNIDPFPAHPTCIKKRSPPKYQVINQGRNCYQSLSRKIP